MTMTQNAAPPRLRGSRPAGLGNTGPVTAGTQYHASVTGHPVPALAAAELDHLRDAVTGALDGFLARQRVTLAGMDATLTPVVDEVAALAAGGKRLRPAFAYWGWRGARRADGGEDEAAVLRAVAGRPRRVWAPSMTSSWTRALACTNSSAATARSTAASSSPPSVPRAPRHPQ